jgi:hypothetical protein
LRFAIALVTDLNSELVLQVAANTPSKFCLLRVLSNLALIDGGKIWLFANHFFSGQQVCRNRWGGSIIKRVKTTNLLLKEVSNKK